MRATGSKAGLLLECQWWANALAEWFDSTSDAADRGNRFHRAIAVYVKTGQAPLPLEEDIAQLYDAAQCWVDAHGGPSDFGAEVGFAWDPVTDTAKMLAEVDRDYSGAPAGHFCATADLIRVDTKAKTGYVGDWKTGDGSKAAPQLRTLALMVARTFGLETVHVEALEVGWDGVRSVCREELDEFALAAHAGALAEALADVPTAKPQPGPHCGDLYCPARATCPAVTAIVAEVIPAEALVRHKWGVTISGPEHAAWLYEQAKAVESAAKAVKDAVKAYVPDGGLSLEDGSVLVEGTRQMPRFDKGKAVGLMRELGATDAQIESCSYVATESAGLKRTGGARPTKARKPKAA